MKYEKQVDKAHYEFSRYMSKERWCSMWHQLDEIQKLKPEKVLEIGPGPGLFKTVAAMFGIKVETLDVDPDLKPDHLGSATDMPFPDAAYDVVCAFQMLEHLPYEASLKAFSEMVRISKRNVIISLPDAEIVWRYNFYVPKVGDISFMLPRPQLSPTRHEFDGEHYWEIGKAGYKVSQVTKALQEIAPARLIGCYRVAENPYHRFFIFEKQQ